MLDTEHVGDLVTAVEPFCTNSIWLGKMNEINSRVRVDSPDDQDALQWIIDNQTDEKIKAIYEALKDRPLVKWKESIKEVVGLDLNEEPGMDE
jgi:hypothetical protein